MEQMLLRAGAEGEQVGVGGCDVGGEGGEGGEVRGEGGGGQRGVELGEGGEERRGGEERG